MFRLPGTERVLLFTDDDIAEQQLVAMAVVFHERVKVSITPWMKDLYTMRKSQLNKEAVWVRVIGLPHHLSQKEMHKKGRKRPPGADKDGLFLNENHTEGKVHSVGTDAGNRWERANFLVFALSSLANDDLNWDVKYDLDGYQKVV